MTQLGTNPQYRTVKGWSGKRYQVQMTQAEIDARETVRLITSILIVTPVMIIVMAFAAGLLK